MSAIINANDFNVTAGDNFSNFGSTINANDFTVTAGDNFSNFGSTINANDFTVTAGEDFYNDETINADNFNVTAGDDFLNQHRATISVDNFNVTAEGSFYNYGSTTNINADNFNATVGDNFNNHATIEANSLTISAKSLVNTNNSTGEMGNIIADKLTLSLTEGFDYTSDYLNNGNIDAATLTILEDE